MATKKKVKYPVLKRGLHSGVVVEFIAISTGKVIVSDDRYPVGYMNDTWTECTNEEFWEDTVLVPEPTSKEIDEMEKDFKVTEVKNDLDSHYKVMGIDTFERSEANMSKASIYECIKFNIDKYNWRDKGQSKKDFEKIIAYAEWGLKVIDNKLIRDV